MLIGEIISVALGALRANKLRSLLTMLGIVIGVGAVIAVVALGTGAQQAVKDRIAALGTTLLTVSPGQQRGGGGGIAIAGAQQRLTVDDAKAVDERATTSARRAARDALAAADRRRQQEREHADHRHDAELSRGSQVHARGRARCSPRPTTKAVSASPSSATRSSNNLGITTPEALVGETGAHSRHAVHRRRRAGAEGIRRTRSRIRTTKSSFRSRRRASA